MAGNEKAILGVGIAFVLYLLLKKKVEPGQYVYMTFRDAYGVEMEFNMTVLAQSNNVTVEEMKQIIINSGHTFVSQRTGG